MTNQLRLLLAALSVGVLTLPGLAEVMWHPRTVYAAENRLVLTGTVKSASGERLAGVIASAKIEDRKSVV